MGPELCLYNMLTPDFKNGAETIPSAIDEFGCFLGRAHSRQLPCSRNRKTRPFLYTFAT